jgi:hypothetical protein
MPSRVDAGCGDGKTKLAETVGYCKQGQQQMTTVDGNLQQRHQQSTIFSRYRRLQLQVPSASATTKAMIVMSVAVKKR